MQTGVLGRPHYRTNVSNSGSVMASGYYPSDLGVEQIGFFKEELGSAPVSVKVPTRVNAPKVKIAIGRAKTPADKTIGNKFNQFPHTTETFRAKDIVSWKGVKAKKTATTDIWAFGYDGVDASKRIVTKLDHRDFVVSLRLWGGPIKKLAGGREFILREYFIDKGCFEGIEDQYVQDEKIVDSLLEQFNKDYYSSPQVGINRFVQARKITKCNPERAALTGLITFTKFRISTCDDGSTSSLGQLQVQYPGYKVEAESRIGATSTYSMWRPNSAGAPANAVISKPVSLAVCSVCPSGYTLESPQFTYSISRPLAGDENLSTGAAQQAFANALKTEYGVTGTATFVSKSLTSATVVFTVDEDTVNALLSDEVSATGETGEICTPPAGTSTAWTSGETCSKAPKEYMITLADTQCGTSRLAELQDKYNDLVVSEVSAGTCARVYKATTYSSCVEPGCYPEDYEFEAPQKFNYHTEWVEFKAPLDDPTCEVDESVAPCCASGIIFETASFYNDYSKCLFGYYDYDPSDVDPVYMEVSMFSRDFGGSLCIVDEAPVTQLRGVEFHRGSGKWVLEMEKTAMHQYYGMVAGANMGMNHAYGLTNFVTDPQLFYDEYKLTINVDYDPSTALGDLNRHMQITYAYYFPVGKGKEFETAVNAMLASIDSEIKPVVLY